MIPTYEQNWRLTPRWVLRSLATYAIAALSGGLIFIFFCFIIVLFTAIFGCAQMNVVVDDVEIACSKVRPLAYIAEFIPGIPASIAVYIIAGCDTIDGLEKLRNDSSSVIWLNDLKKQLEQQISMNKG